MEINGIPFDKAAACHSLALAYAEGVFNSKLRKGEGLNGGPEASLDKMYRAYLKAFSHLSGKSEEWIAAQLDSL